MTFWDSDLEELAGTASTMQTGAFDLTPFAVITDEDGEALFVKSDKIMLMDSVDYSPILEEEMDEYKAEMKEAEDKKRRRVIRVVKPKASPAVDG